VQSLIRVVHGSADALIDAAGQTIGQIQESLKHALNVSVEAFAFVGGAVVSEQYVLRPGDSVEFVYPSGRKGGIPSDQPLRSPFPYFGGKARVAPEIWRRFGDVKNYVEPLFGGGAVLLNRPRWSQAKMEIVNDVDALLANFWRALKLHPRKLAKAADYPISELDFHARQSWMIEQQETISERLREHEAWCDPKVAAWWVWGVSQQIGGGFPRKNSRGRPSVEGRGVHRFVFDQPRGDRLREEFGRLAKRLEHVRILQGDWSRAVTESMTYRYGITGIFLDPPYVEESGRSTRLYAKDDLRVGHRVGKWAVANGNNPLLRIALCGYEGDYEMPSNWSVYGWKGGGSKNGRKERIWFSPHCLPASGLMAG